MEQRQLRSGYTTGTCASAAAKAAAVFLLEKRMPGTVAVHMPEGKVSFWEPEPEEGTEQAAAVLSGNGDILKNAGYWLVYKDSGDDPDVTNGTRICAGVFPVGEAEFQKLVRSGPGYYLEDFPGLYLNGGTGIGMVTKPGLSCPVGHYAINPVPRRMILSAVDEVRRGVGYAGFLEIRLMIPEGVLLAEKTFNPNLGIVGGISVLGTTGIVEPMSEQALVETVRLDIRMRAAVGEKTLLMTPGNYGEAFLQERLGVSLGQAVKCSNFIADSVEIAAEEGFSRILLVGHIGKLVKVTGGVRNTHSRYGDRRMELMERLAADAWGMLGTAGLEAGGKPELTEPEGRGRPELAESETEGASELAELEVGGVPELAEPDAVGVSGAVEREARERMELLGQVRNANTTEEALELLERYGMAARVMELAACRVKEQLELWGNGRLQAEAIVFASSPAVIGKTEHAEDLFYMWKEQR